MFHCSNSKRQHIYNNAYNLEMSLLHDEFGKTNDLVKEVTTCRSVVLLTHLRYSQMFYSVYFGSSKRVNIYSSISLDFFTE